MKARTARTQPRKRSPARRRKPLPRELNVGEAKALFSQLVDEAARGARFVIAKAGTPVARIVPLEAEPKKIVFGTMKGLLSPEEEHFEAKLAASNFVPLTLTWSHAVRAYDVAPFHRDPFDRLLLAQAVTEPLHLLTTDESLKSYSSLVIAV